MKLQINYTDHARKTDDREHLFGRSEKSWSIS